MFLVHKLSLEIVIHVPKFDTMWSSNFKNEYSVTQPLNFCF